MASKTQLEYRHTKRGLISRMYGHQRAASKKRGHPLPTYSNEDLQDWLSSQTLFHHLFHLWENSNYDKLLIPSVDRIDDDEGYSFSNIQLMTWSENKAKSHKDMRASKLKHGHNPQKEVNQYSKKGTFIEGYVSLS